MNKSIISLSPLLLAGCIQAQPTTVDTKPTAEPIPTVQPPKSLPKRAKALVWYGEREGTRKHPKLVERSSFAIIVDNWAYLPAMKGETRRKRTDGKHFRILEIYPRAPKGTAEAFKLIERSIKS